MAYQASNLYAKPMVRINVSKTLKNKPRQVPCTRSHLHPQNEYTLILSEFDTGTTDSEPPRAAAMNESRRPKSYRNTVAISKFH